MSLVVHDGVKLFYEEAGAGDPPLLLVHGWCCDHTYVAPQFEYFRRSHRVVAVDLRGHGQSDKPEQEYTLAGFAEDLAWLCSELDLTKPVVIGHSMGGRIATRLAADHPELPAALVLLDAPLLLREPVRQGMQSLIAALWTPAYREAASAFVANRLFLTTDDAKLKERTVTGMASAPQHVMASAMQQLAASDGSEVLAACSMPVLNVTAGSQAPDLPRLQALCPNWVYGQTVGAGHFLQLLVPEQVNAMIERFLAIYLRVAA